MGHRTRVSIAIAAGLAGAALVSSCTRPVSAPAVAPEAAQASQSSILVSSRPAAGSTVNGPVNELMLHFNPPARLDEVTVSGPEGMMPMMITPVGETAHYSIPLSGLGAGSYTVNWRATAQGREHRGSFSFSVT